MHPWVEFLRVAALSGDVDPEEAGVASRASHSLEEVSKESFENDMAVAGEEERATAKDETHGD